MADSLTVEEIINRAGGVGPIADASEGGIQKWSVYKWAKSGIPDRHWRMIMGLSGVTAEQMLAANEVARLEANLPGARQVGRGAVTGHLLALFGFTGSYLLCSILLGGA